MANQKFADHVTSIAFHLSLSRQMVICLVEVRERQQLIEKHGEKEGERLILEGFRPGRSRWRALGMPSNQVPAYWALERRGLVEQMPEKFSERGWGKQRLTKAGELVFGLLEEAGLIERLEEATGQTFVA